MAPRLELFPFRYRDELTGKWVRARYLAERHVIAERFAEFEIMGPAEIRNVDPEARYFEPHRRAQSDDNSIRNLGPVLTIAGWGKARRVAIAGVAV
jgi:hypothetical protein